MQATHSSDITYVWVGHLQELEKVSHKVSGNA